MITANELRIGNYILNRGKIDRVESINEYGVNLCVSALGDLERDDVQHLEPILITYEILEGAGFVKVEREFKWTDGTIQIPYVINETGEYYLLVPYDFYAKEIKHVHQLQNLYFALTGIELHMKMEDLLSWIKEVEF